MIKILIVTLFIKESLTQSQPRCTDGDVRLVGTPQGLRSQGRVEVCVDSNWGTVCRDNWDNNDAAVVCNQLHYGRDGAAAFWGERTNTDVIEVYCDSNEAGSLTDCSHYRRGYLWYHCRYGGGAAVRCREEQLRVHNVSTVTINTTTHTITISWELNNNAPHQPNSFKVECFSQKYPEFSLSVNNGTVTQISLRGLIFSTSYSCCVSARYYYDTERRCSSTDNLPPEEFTTPASAQIFTTPASVELNEFIISDLNMKAKVIGGVLGSIIVVLLILLAISGGTLLYLLRSRTSGVVPKRPPQPHSANTMDMYIGRNISYVAAPSHSTTNGSQATQATRAAGNQDETGAAAEYSRIGPSYATTDNNSSGRQPVAGRNRVSARLAEWYEFSETRGHLAMASAGGSGGQEETAMNYEVPLQSGEHEEYSHLQH